MSIEARTVRCSAEDPGSIGEAIAREFGDDPMSLTVFFASPAAPFAEVAGAIDTRVGGPTIGCTTAGEICGELGHCENSVVAMGLRSDALDVRTKLIENASGFTTVRADDEVSGLIADRAEGEAGGSFGMVLIDGLSQAEERVAGSLSHAFKDIPFAGGSAGDNLDFRETFVACDGVVAQDAAVVAVVNTALPFRIFHSHHFETTDEMLVITEAVPSERRVTEINGQPAAEGYAEAIGLSVDDLSPEVFASHPVLLTVGGAPFVRSIQRMDPDGSLVFYCAIEEGLVLRVARATDLGRTLRSELESIAADFDIAAVVAFDCVLRKLEILGKQQRDRVRGMMSGLPLVGFSTYGEQYNGLHVNQTLTGVAIGRAA